MTLTAAPDEWRRRCVRTLERDGLIMRGPDGRWYLTRRARASLARLETGEHIDQLVSGRR